MNRGSPAQCVHPFARTEFVPGNVARTALCRNGSTKSGECHKLNLRRSAMPPGRKARRTEVIPADDTRAARKQFPRRDGGARLAPFKGETGLGAIWLPAAHRPNAPPPFLALDGFRSQIEILRHLLENKHNSLRDPPSPANLHATLIPKWETTPIPNHSPRSSAA
jgi:hypothetical protein